MMMAKADVEASLYEAAFPSSLDDDGVEILMVEAAGPRRRGAWMRLILRLSAP
jgi:hypothetical protein